MFELSKQIEEWYLLSLKDNEIPLNLLITTNSMYPTIVANKDTVVILNQENYVLGDIILYKKDKIYILHRIIKIKDKQIITMGDNNSYIDKPISFNEIMGKAVLIKSADRNIDLTNIEIKENNEKYARRYRFRLLKNKIRNRL